MSRKTEQLILLPTLAALCLVGGCKPVNPARRTSPATTPVSVKVMEVKAKSSVVSDCYVASVESGRRTVLSNQTPGTVREVYCRVGQVVPAGKPLVSVESPSLQSASDIAKAKLDQAEDGWKRINILRKSRSVPEIKVVEVKTALDQAKAAYKAAQKALEDTLVKAPFHGIIEKVYAIPGVKASIAEAMIEIVDVDMLEIHFSLPENEYFKVKVGDAVRVCVSSLDKEFPGIVSSKGVVASKLSHCYDCCVLIKGNTTGVMPGMVCKVYTSTSGNDRIVVPASAISTDMQGRCVWLVEDSLARKCYVRTGDFSGEGIIITEGLKAGDLVIVEGSSKVSGGMKVNPVR